jgi:hypothetical protein
LNKNNGLPRRDKDGLDNLTGPDGQDVGRRATRNERVVVYSTFGIFGFE